VHAGLDFQEFASAIVSRLRVRHVGVGIQRVGECAGIHTEQFLETYGGNTGDSEQGTTRSVTLRVHQQHALEDRALWSHLKSKHESKS